MQEQDELFGQLRAMLQERPRPGAEVLERLLVRAHGLGPERYADEWIPYLGEFELPVWMATSLERLQELDQLLPTSAARHLALQELVGGDEVLRRLAEESALRGVHTLRLTGIDMSAAGVRALLASEHAGHIRELALSHNEMSDKGTEALADHPRSAQLERLYLTDCGIGPAGASALAKSPHLRGLEGLTLMQNPLTDTGVEALAQATWPALRWLNLVGVDHTHAIEELSWPAAWTVQLDRRTLVS